MASSNYPPGVTGNEPQITGIWPPEQVADELTEELGKAFDIVEEAIGQAEDQGLSFDEKSAEGILTKIDAFKADLGRYLE